MVGCQTTLSNAISGGAVKCVGAPAGSPNFEEWALEGVLDGSCSAAGGVASSNVSFAVFQQPIKLIRTSFFRTRDLSTPAPTNAPGTSDAFTLGYSLNPMVAILGARFSSL